MNSEHFLKVLVCLFCISGILFSQPPAENTSLLQATPDRLPETKEIEIETQNLAHFGDLIDIDLIGSTEFDWRGKINPEGFLDIKLYDGSSIYALCKSEEEIGSEIAKSLGKFLREPKIEVKILDRSGRSLAYIYGAVKTPQRLSIRRKVRLNEIIILSGGITESASGAIRIISPPKADCSNNSADEAKISEFNIRDLISGKPESNPFIKLGDIITVDEAGPVYIIGGVNNPKSFLFRNKLTLSRLIAMAGGLSKDAEAKNITIFRRRNGATQTFSVNFEKIRLKQFDDIELEKYDIIEVGQAGRREVPSIPKIDIIEKTESKANLPLRIID